MNEKRGKGGGMFALNVKERRQLGVGGNSRGGSTN